MGQALEQAAGELTAGGVENAHLEAEVLLRHALRLTRVELYTNANLEVSREDITTLQALLKRRINREPSAYITGYREFSGLEFEVNPSVLIPRPETEILVEMAIELSNSSFASSFLIADIGTGCGAIAIALAVNLHRSKIYAIDVSDAALKVAGTNCRRLGVEDRVILLRGDLFEPLPEPVHIIVSNPPYIRKSVLDTLSPEIRGFEPSLALNGGGNGLDMIERLLSQAAEHLVDGGVVLIEIGYDQGQSACAIARKYFPEAEISIMKDLGGLDRVLRIVTVQQFDAEQISFLADR